jgi:hypothetical protein
MRTKMECLTSIRPRNTDLYKEDLLLKPFDCFLSKLTIVSEEAKHSEDNKTEDQEHIVDSSIKGSATVKWDEERRQWNPVPKRKVRLTIEDYETQLVGNWEYNSGCNPDIYDRPAVFHVGQDRDFSQGNCSKYHCKCTRWEQCSKNEEDRVESERQQKGQKRGKPLRKRAEKKKPGRRKR